MYSTVSSLFHVDIVPALMPIYSFQHDMYKKRGGASVCYQALSSYQPVLLGREKYVDLMIDTCDWQ